MPKPKPPPIGRCVHCLTENVPRNWDHVIPKSWYPDTTPANLEKWTVPSCFACNASLGIIEDELLRYLICCVNPNTEAASGIYKRILRSMDPNAAKSEKDARIRLARRNKLLEGMLHGEEIPEKGIYPGLEERWARPRQNQSAIIVTEKSFRRATEKIVRGITYIETEQFIESPYEIDFFALTDIGAADLIDLLDLYGTTYQRGPGIQIRKLKTTDDPVAAMFSIKFWNTVTMYASVMPRENNDLTI
ncbi:HNH endonuclease [Undibacterium danionis]|uniref:HNH endonuclease n=1 Tax=Undibacterium danionis TaxID=1812100 RepID=A0ABV6IDC3_9BURK